jgi:hypothetical protein
MQKELTLNKKNLQQQNMCVLESQITKSDLRSHNLRLHPIHLILNIAFTLELIPN